jgi:hypothetical protein
VRQFLSRLQPFGNIGWLKSNNSKSCRFPALCKAADVAHYRRDNPSSLNIRAVPQLLRNCQILVNDDCHDFQEAVRAIEEWIVRSNPPGVLMPTEHGAVEAPILDQRGVVEALVPCSSTDPPSASQQLVALYKRDREASSEQLVLVERERDAARDEMKTWKRKYEETNAELMAMKARHRHACPSDRGSKRYFLLADGINLGMRAIISSASSTRFGASQGSDVHHTTVQSWKLKLHAGLAVFSHQWYADAYEILQQAPEGPVETRDACGIRCCKPCSLLVTASRTDATPSSVWNNSKLFVTEQTSAFIDEATFLAKTPTTLEAVEGATERHRIVCDVLPQTDGTGQGTHALVTKQLKSVGAMPIGELVATSLKEGARTLCICLNTSDCGPDELYNHKMNEAEAIAAPLVIPLRAPCFLHQQSLDAKESYKLADKMMKIVWNSKYAFYASLAKVMNTWRAFFVAIVGVWETIDHTTLVLYSKSVPPRCISTRWESPARCEEHVPSHNLDHFAIFGEVMRRASVTKASKKKVVDDDEFDPNQEEQQSWRAQYGKWAADTVGVLNEQMSDIMGNSYTPFRCISNIRRRARDPWDHFIGVVTQRPDAASKATPRAVALLVWKKADEIANEFEKLCDMSAWEDIIVQAQLEVTAIAK